MIQHTNNACSYASSLIRSTAHYLCGRPERKPQLYIVGGMRDSSITQASIDKIQERIDAGEYSRATAVQKLREIRRNPITVKRPLHIIYGYAHVSSQCIGTDFKAQLQKYIEDLSNVRTYNFFSSMYKNMSLDDYAVEFMEDLHKTYHTSLADEIRIDVAGHSMGAAIAALATKKMQKPFRGKKYTVVNLFSMNGANRGAPIAALSKLLCCPKNVAKDLVPGAIDFQAPKVENAEYYATSNDSIIPIEYSAPSGWPVVVFDDVHRAMPHSMILSYPVVLAAILSNAQSSYIAEPVEPETKEQTPPPVSMPKYPEPEAKSP